MQIKYASTKYGTRKTAYYGTADYAYSTSKHRSNQITIPSLQDVLHCIQRVTGKLFNSILINLYEDGNMYMPYHADDERTLGEQPFIASLSLGTARPFIFKNKETNSIKQFWLDTGSLLIMYGNTNKYWLHSLPKYKCDQARVNITFRQVMC